MPNRTFQGVIDQLTISVVRDDLLAGNKYLDFVNQAVRKIAELHSFEQMKATGAGAVNAGQTRATLPADFKELQSGRYPVFDTPSGSAGKLVPVFPRSEVEKLLDAGLVPEASYVYTQDFTGGAAQFFLDLPLPATVAHALVIYYFSYPPECTDPSNDVTTPLIQYYYDLVVFKALSIAFESINDPVYETHEKQFLGEFGLLTGIDVRKALAVFKTTEKS